MWREAQLVSERVRTLALTAPGSAEWLEALPELIEDLEKRWQLTLGPALKHDGYTAVVLPAETAFGERAVLKVGVPHLEGRDEAAGLRYWDGDPTVRLLRHWNGSSAMLLERCEPGHSLNVLPPEERDEVLGRLVPRLWRRPPGGEFRPLAEQMDYWTEESREDEARWPDPELVREGLAVWQELARPGPEDVLLGTDVHAGNVLAAERGPWLVIDPKPFVGDPAYDATQHLLDSLPRLRADPLGLVERYAALLDLPVERVLAWTFARCAAERRDTDEEWAEHNALARRLAPA